MGYLCEGRTELSFYVLFLLFSETVIITINSAKDYIIKEGT